MQRMPGSSLNRTLLSLLTLVLVVFAGNAVRAADTMTMWIRSEGSNFMPPMVKRFNELHADQIKLELVLPQELVRKFATASAAGEAPDALSLDLIYTPQLIHHELLEDITDYAKSLPFLPHLSPGHMRMASKDGRIYGLPFAAEASFLIYNKDHYKKAGLDPEKPPRNFAEWKDAVVALSKIDPNIYGFFSSLAGGGNQSFTFLPLIWASGGDVLNADGSKATLNTKAVKEALQFYRELYQAGALPETAQSDGGANRIPLFAAGRVGMVNGGTFNVGRILKDHPDFNIGATPIPGKDGSFATFAGGENIVIPKGSKKLAIAKQFIEWSYTLEGQTLLAQYGSLPPRLDISAEALKTHHPVYRMAANLLLKGNTPYCLNYMELFNNNNGPWIEMIQNAVFTDGDIDAITAAAEKHMQEIIDSNR